MGPSGSGKSTLMNILGCLDTLTRGSYHLAGEDVGELDEIDLADIRNRRIGFVFQQFHLLPSLSAWRNVELPAGLRPGARRAVRRDRAVAALDRVGLGRPARQPPRRAVRRPAAARRGRPRPRRRAGAAPRRRADGQPRLDVHRRTSSALFDELHAQGRTIVLITHEADVAERARADRARARRPDRQSDGCPMTWTETLRTGWSAVHVARACARSSPCSASSSASPR